jgi:NADPH:quinone reductase-like Zn-dependent oxidoreductase
MTQLYSPATTTTGRSMRQLQHARFGGPHALRWSMVPIPALAAGELLVRVHATSLDAAESLIRSNERRALPWAPGPARTVGRDFAGEVASVGPGVRGFAIGDRVVGLSTRRAGFADYATIDAAHATLVPADMSYAEATCLPVNGASAWGAFHAMKIDVDDTVLLVGADTGVGLFLLQLLEREGIRVSAVGATSSHRQLTFLGADDVMTARELGAPSVSSRFTTIVDVSGVLPFAAAKPMLQSRGTLYTMSPSLNSLAMLALTVGSRKKARFIVGGDSLAATRSLVADFNHRAIGIIVGLQRPLTEAISVMAAIENGELHTAGTTVLTSVPIDLTTYDPSDPW